MSKPIIGISCSYYEVKGRDTCLLGSPYLQAVQAAGGVPLILPVLNSEDELHQLLDLVQGVIMVGGKDLPATLWHAEQSPAATDLLHPQRIEHDFRLWRLLAEHKIPTLAICLGLQELNVARGGTLIQDIPSEIDTRIIHRHNGGADARHPVVLEGESRLAEILGVRELEINSAHHQAVGQIGSELKVTARAPDGIVEGLEPLEEDWPCVAVQWHPERDLAGAGGLVLFKWVVGLG